MDEPLEETIDDAGRAVGSFLEPVVGAAVGVVVAYVLAWLVGVLATRIARRHPVIAHVSRRCRRPFRAVAVVLGAWIGLVVATPIAPGEDEPVWRGLAQHTFVILLILAAAWLVTSVVAVAEDALLGRHRLDAADNRRARRVHTQVQVLRRVAVAVVWTCALAAVLLTFPGARAVGASVLASAGLISIVAGLAAQSALANVFAGMQLAFTDAMRVDDVVFVEGETGRIEEITLTYVVVHLWDDRRLILPSTYFTTTPFQNHTRRAADLLGTVELDLDWRVPVAAMRAELAQLLAHTDMWDERVGVLQVTDAVNGVVRIRVLLSAPDGGALFDLRCYVREGLVDWLQREAPYALPRTRLEAEEFGALPEATVDDESAWEAATDGDGDGDGDGEGEGDGTDDGDGDKDETDEPDETGEPDEPGEPARAGNGDDGGESRLGGLLRGKRARKRGGVPPGAGDEESGAPTGSEPAETPAGPRRTSLHERTSLADIERDSRFYTGTLEGMVRAKVFRGPGEEVIAEREENAKRGDEPDDGRRR